jgi:L-asparaginase
MPAPRTAQRNALNETGDGVLVIMAGGNIGLFADERRREWVVRPATEDELQRLIVGDVSPSQRGIGGTLTLREGSVRGRQIRVNFKTIRSDDHIVYEPEDLDSAQVEPTLWEALAATIKEQYSNYEGFVILHGLDTMAYTAAALSFMLGNPSVPIVLTGAQRPLNYGRTDAIQNIISSIVVAAGRSLGLLPVVPEVCVYSHDTLFRGNRVTMTSSSSYRSFDSPNYPPLAIAGEDIEIQSHVIRPPGNRLNIDYRSAATARVVILDVFPGMDARLIASLKEQHPVTPADAAAGTAGRRASDAHDRPLRGVLVRTYGMGTAPTSQPVLRALAELVDAGIVVMNVTQARSGRISHGNDPVSLRLMEQGVVSGVDMTAEAAYAKMVVYLSEGDDARERADALQIAACGEQSQSVFNIHYGPGATHKEEGSYSALLHAQEMVGRHQLDREDISHVQLRMLGVRPSSIAVDVNRTIDLTATLVDRFQERTEKVAELAEVTLRWRTGGRETVNIAHDITLAARQHILRPNTILELETEEAIEWTRLSVVIFANVAGRRSL